MAETAATLKPTDEQKLNKLGKFYPYRASVRQHIATNTYANTFSPENFPESGLDIAEVSSKISKPGENAYNNLITTDRKPRFKFEPQLMGFMISDPGSEAVRSMLLEHARLEVWFADQRIVNEPLIALPPGLSVDRDIVTTEADTSIVSERHAMDGQVGVFKLPDGVIWDEDHALSLLLYVPASLRAALAALTGRTPAQGFAFGAIFYGKAFGKAGTSI